MPGCSAVPRSKCPSFDVLASQIGLGPEFLGRVRLASSIASLFGVWIFQNFLKETKISQVLFWTTILAVPLGLTQVGRSDKSATRTQRSIFLYSTLGVASREGHLEAMRCNFF